MAFVGAPVGAPFCVGSRTHASRANVGNRRNRFNTGSVRVSRRASPVVCSNSSSSSSATSGGSVAKTEEETAIKRFLSDLGGLGRVRLVTNNGLAVLESITPLGKLFYATARGAEYGNVIDHSLNVDLHIKLEAVKAARFEIGQSRSKPSHPTYAIRLLGGDMKTVGLSMFIQWDNTADDVSPERIAHWKRLKAEYAGDDGDVALFN